MTYVLDERDGVLYAKHTFTSHFEPKEITDWWPLSVSFATFLSWFSDAERAKAVLGSPLSPLCNPAVSFQSTSGVYRRKQGCDKPDYTEITPIQEPKQRGRKLPLEWKNGAWYKQTSRGLVKAS